MRRASRYLARSRTPTAVAAIGPAGPATRVATYQALDALDTLARAMPPSPRASQSPDASVPLRDGLRVFTIQIEAHGQGSPREAVALAQGYGSTSGEPRMPGRNGSRGPRRSPTARVSPCGSSPQTRNTARGSACPAWAPTAIRATSSRRPPADIGPSLANQGVVSWPDFRARRLAPLQAAGGRLVWQFGENEELVRIYLDDSLERGGYAAISTFHFGNPDFTNTEPFLGGYRGQIPFVALQDAHGGEPWWFADMTEGFRTLFLAREPTWEGWLEALRQQLGRRRPPRRRERVRDLDARRVERGGQLRPPPRGATGGGGITPRSSARSSRSSH